MIEKINIKNFSTKFIDIMIGIVLGLGFQWWMNLKDVWQYIAFIFVYLDIVDYWIDYGPSLKKFPPKKEIDIFLDLAICFSLFLYIYTTQFSLAYFVLSLGLVKLFDFFWLLSSKLEYQPTGFEKKFMQSWMILDGVEIFLAIIIAVISLLTNISPLILLLIFIALRIIIRISASYHYKKVYLTN